MIETHYDCPCLEKCPLNYAMSIIGGKWKMQIICSPEQQGTAEIQRAAQKAGRHIKHGAGLLTERT